ncbi:hypothetical protein AcV5_010118 [Taiwanofungus camphoratus]|nr:hypothetical protein AcV5_010118 [Antrodia cinnamomea]
MKEILYIQAGSLSNYIGTHFWNTQESYFTYEEDEEPEVIHDISFREGSTSKGESTYCPRLLLFDRKANFGSLSGLNGLYNDDDESSGGGQLWNGDVVEYRQEPISQSDYQARLDAEVDDAKESNALGDKPREAEASPSDVRYWSDYNRVFFHPRTLQRLPDVADWESAEGDWGSSKAAFGRHNADASLMEEPFRLFVEECDTLQGIQVMNDTATFGGFTDSFLTAFRDEFPKLPCLTFSILSRAFPGPSGPDDDLGTRKAINDALCLQSLDELSTLSVPIQAPATWSTGEWLEGTSLNASVIYIHPPFSTPSYDSACEAVQQHLSHLGDPVRSHRERHPPSQAEWVRGRSLQHVRQAQLQRSDALRASVRRVSLPIAARVRARVRRTDARFLRYAARGRREWPMCAYCHVC